MPIEQELLTLLNNHNEAIQVARSYWQQLANSSYVEEEVREEYEKQEGVICLSCRPSLIMIPSPRCYQLYYPGEKFAKGRLTFQHEWASHVPFEGVRGFLFAFSDGTRHIDVVEMDNPDYFDGLIIKGKNKFVRYFYDNLSLAVSSDQRNHLSLTSEIFAAFVSTRISKADYKTFTYETGWVIDKAVRIK